MPKSGSWSADQFPHYMYFQKWDISRLSRSRVNLIYTRVTIRESNSLDQDPTQHFIGPDLVPKLFAGSWFYNITVCGKTSVGTHSHNSDM